MKTILRIIVGCFLCHSGFAQIAHSITDINNNTISTDSLNGKKLLIIILPVQQDTEIINQLLRFQNKYGQSIKVIGLVASSPGNISIDSTGNIYKNVNSRNIIITGGLQTADTAITERESVLSWLTAKSQNREKDLFATGSKYFLSENGRLYAQLGSKISLDDRIIKNLVNTVVPQRTLLVQQPPPPPSPPPPITDTLKTNSQQPF